MVHRAEAVLLVPPAISVVSNGVLVPSVAPLPLAVRPVAAAPPLPLLAQRGVTATRVAVASPATMAVPAVRGEALPPQGEEVIERCPEGPVRGLTDIGYVDVDVPSQAA